MSSSIRRAQQGACACVQAAWNARVHSHAAACNHAVAAQWHVIGCACVLPQNPAGDQILVHVLRTRGLCDHRVQHAGQQPRWTAAIACGISCVHCAGSPGEQHHCMVPTDVE
eukprot:CAMPEP_0181196738 /NCGR_PEP_ID=MMETSP1096-20121128/15628_1 /TAXON_ID=156174 ORGANISM="Chrysochromulina ericina, Strain CCMP281" /NCGR_SAMPLE_ID=MMETSP1096 /ASSEMBLY_ACC=CAM_ASM_000453 /LENGTH=111 /DNA_ID=CAMNT_0023286523 /DNA_START=257 /DNA_END=593 /DNA_ORIENTATION=-